MKFVLEFFAHFWYWQTLFQNNLHIKADFKSSSWFKSLRKGNLFYLCHNILCWSTIFVHAFCKTWSYRMRECHIFRLIEKINVPILFLNMCAKRAFCTIQCIKSQREKRAEFFCTINEWCIFGFNVSTVDILFSSFFTGKVLNL